ncbi:MAG: hypothetical protein OIF58_11200 [Cohaesibacter sp.]|nr:hypothetical protein [Cohaesibacter sp.]
MSECGRKHEGEVYLRLMGGVRSLIKACFGLEAAAEETRVSFATLSRYQRNSNPEFAPIDVVIDLEKSCGRPIVTQAMARANDCTLVKLPKVEASGDIVSRLGTLHKEMADVTGRIGECLADDGCISSDEAKQTNLRKEIDDLLCAVVAMDAEIKVIEEGGL